MGRFILSFFLVFFLASCSKKDTGTTSENSVLLEEPSSQSSVEVPSTPEEEGLKLIQGMDCLSCHKDDAKLIGPSYQEIADKYTEADIDLLAQRIIDGSVGTWGQVPMTPHAGLSKENAKKMVQYIMSLKK